MVTAFHISQVIITTNIHDITNLDVFPSGVEEELQLHTSDMWLSACY